MPIDPAKAALITFDCYGTLVDWESGILGACAAMAGGAIPDADRARVLGAYAAIEREIEAGPYMAYGEVLKRVGERMCEQFGWSGNGNAIADSIGDWPAFDETPACLRALQEHYKVGVLSNIDDDLFALTAPKLGIELDLLVTAQRVKSYKPGEAHFREALRAMGIQPGWMVHCAESRFHDIEPASRLGIPNVWVDRAMGSGAASGGPAGGVGRKEPDAVVHSLRELIELLGLSLGG